MSLYLIQLGDKMYLQALNDGFVVLEPGVEFLSVDNFSPVLAPDRAPPTRIRVQGKLHAHAPIKPITESQFLPRPRRK